MKIAAPLLSLLSLFTSALAQEASRTWTSNDGRKIEATLVSADTASVQLKLPNGSNSTVPINRLSPADQEYVKKWREAATSKKPAPTTSALAPWPTSIGLDEAPEATVVKEDDAGREYIYQTEHYEFQCDSRLGKNTVREFSRIFEATYLANQKLPMDFRPQPEEGRERFLCKLFTDEDDYFKAGAIPGSAGVYMSGPGRNLMMVPLKSLGVKMVGKRVSIDHNDRENSTMVHEITHQVNNRIGRFIPVWFSEGNAEYVASAKYKTGRFSFARMGSSVQEYLQAYKGLRSKEFNMWKLDYLLNVTNRQWNSAIGDDKTISMRNYSSACILTYYFYHIDGEGNGQHIANWLRELRNGAKLKDATATHLIRGRSHQEIEKEIAQAMRKDGIDITFVEGTLNSGDDD